MTPPRAILTALSAVLAAACAREEEAKDPPPAPPPGFSAPWVPFVAATELAGAYDSTRLARRADTVDVWLRFHYDRPQPLPGDSARSFRVTEAHQSVDCASRRTRDIRLRLLGAADDSVAGFTHPSPAWQPFARHGMGDRIFVRLCDAMR